jgi:hypothetical protein
MGFTQYVSYITLNRNISEDEECVFVVWTGFDWLRIGLSDWLLLRDHHSLTKDCAPGS